MEVLRPDEADDAVDQEWIEGTSDAVSPRFEGELIDAVVGVGRQGAPLPRFKIHDAVANPCHITPAMLFQNALTTLAQHR